MHRVSRGLLLLALGTVAPAAWAYPNDLDYSGLVKTQGDCDPFSTKGECEPLKNGDKVVPDQRGYDGLVEELGTIMAPRWVGAAGTPGQAGFDLGAEVTVHKFNNQHSYWSRALERSAVQKANRDFVYPVMGTAQLWLRKGLPYGLEGALGGTYLLESRMFALGAQGRWALSEGFFWLPDFALTGGINRVLCVGLPSQPPLNATDSANGTVRQACGTDPGIWTAALGATVGKTFSLLGMVTVSPFVGWQKIFVHASSPYVDQDETTNDRTGEAFRFRDYKVWGDLVGQDCGEAETTVQDCITASDGSPQLANLFLRRNKLYAGLRARFAVLEATVQGELTHVRGTEWAVDGVAVDGEVARLRGVKMPDLQYAATFRVGLLF
jgi:hypothetical protein